MSVECFKIIMFAHVKTDLSIYTSVNKHKTYSFYEINAKK